MNKKYAHFYTFAWSPTIDKMIYLEAKNKVKDKPVALACPVICDIDISYLAGSSDRLALTTSKIKYLGCLQS